MRKVASVLLLLMLAACKGQQHLGPGAYVQYISAAGSPYIRTVTAGNYEYTIQLATPEYMAVQEGATEPEEYIKRRIAELKGHVFFLIKIGTTEQSRVQSGATVNSAGDADARAAYYDQQAALDILLKDGAHEYHPVTYHFENNYGLSPYNTIVAGFEADISHAANLQLSFQDRFTGTSGIHAGFDRTELSRLPVLQLN